MALQQQLTIELEEKSDSKTINIERISKIVRQLITLADSIEAQIALFDHAQSVAMHLMSSSIVYPKLEAQWLVSRSWNNGVISYR
jgi:hypothetical protein